MDSIKNKLPATLTTDRLVLATPSLAHVPEMAALADDDVAGDDSFATELLHAETTASGITTVAG